MDKALLLVLLGLLLSWFLPVADNQLMHYLRASNSDVTTDGNSDILGGGDILDGGKDIFNDAEDKFNDLLNSTRSNVLGSLRNISRYLPMNVLYTLTVGQNCSNIVHYNKPFYSEIPLILSGVFILLGVILGFFGYRLIKIVLFLIGFIAGFTVTYFVFIGLTHGLTQSWLPYVALGVAAVVGGLVGLLTICIYYVGIFLAGGSIGFLVAWFILGAINVTYLREHIYIPIIIAIVVGIAIGIVALIVQKWFFMLGTAILGAFKIAWGLDYYIELGSMVYYLLLFAENRSSLKPCWYSWIMVPLFIILALAGFFVQALLTGRKYDHKKEMKGLTEECDPVNKCS